MANEIAEIFEDGTTGNYVLVLNPDNAAQARNVDTDTWETLPAAGSHDDFKVTLASPGTAIDSAREIQFANLPTGLSADTQYRLIRFDSSGNYKGGSTTVVSSAAAETMQLDLTQELSGTQTVGEALNAMWALAVGEALFEPNEGDAGSPAGKETLYNKDGSVLETFDHLPNLTNSLRRLPT